jgi:chaperonin cofactor prefoldin
MESKVRAKLAELINAQQELQQQIQKNELDRQELIKSLFKNDGAITELQKLLEGK